MSRCSIIFAACFILSCGGRPQKVYHPQFVIGQSLYLQGDDMEAAENALIQAFSAKPTVHNAFLLADLYDNTGQPNKALERYLAALRMSHRDGTDSHSAIASAMGVVALRNRIANFHQKLADFLKSINEEAGALPLEAWHQLLNLKFGLLRSRGQFDDALATRTALGCITDWQLAGPFGPWVWKGFDSPNEQVEGVEWPKAVDLGPGRGKTKVRSVNAETCFVTLDNPEVPLGGVTYARTVIKRMSSGKVHLRLHAKNTISVRIGETEILTRDTRRKFLGNVTWYSIDLPAGQTEVSVKMATNSAVPSFSLQLMNGDGTPAFSEHAPELTATATPTIKDSTEETSNIQTEATPVDQYAAMKIALWFDEMDEARKHIDAISNGGARYAPALLLNLAELTAADPALPGNLAYEQARPYLSRALRQEPRFYQARIGLAYRELDEDRMQSAVQLLEEGIRLCPNEVTLPRKLADTYLSYDWYVETKEMVHRIETLLPDACNTYAWKLALARKRLFFDEAKALAEKITACNAFSEGKLDEAKRSDDYDSFISEASRLAAQSPKNSNLQVNLATAKTAVEDLTGAAAATQAALELSPLSGDARLTLADTMNVLGKRAKSIKTLEKGLTSPLSPKPLLLEAISALGETALLSDLRINGLDVVAEYKAADHSYDNAAVYVLDRAVYDIDENGAQVMVVHTITHLQTDEAVEEHGELSVPSGARLLTARTIKEDGRILEPEEVDRKETLSMPELQPGDFVESEYVLFDYPNQLFPGGFDTGRFFFQDFDTAFHRTEIIVRVPDEMSITFDERGNCPKLEEERRNGKRILIWKTRNATPYPEEPLSPDASEYLPSIRVASNANFENLFNRVSDQLADKDRNSHIIETAIIDATKNLESKDIASLQYAIYRWIMENIASQQDTLGEASHMIADRAGNRARIYAAMLKSINLPARLVLVKSIGEDETENAVASLQLFTHLLVDIGENKIIDLSSEHAPFGFISPALRNRPMRYLDNGAPANTGNGTIKRDSQDIEISLVVDSRGAATGEITETLTGALAAQWRSGLEKNHDLEQKRIFQGAYLGMAIPGATLKTLDIIGQKTPETPLIFKYSVIVPNFAHQEGDLWRIEVPFSTNMGKQTGGLPTRVTDLVMGLYISKSVAATITLPYGSRVLKTTPIPSQDSPWGTISHTMSSIDENVTLKYRTKADIPRVSPQIYSRFLEFANEVDKTSKLTFRYETHRSD